MLMWFIVIDSRFYMFCGRHLGSVFPSCRCVLIWQTADKRLPPGLFLLPLRQSANTRGSMRLLATISLHQQHWAVCGFFHEPCATSYQCVTVSESQPKEGKEQKHQHHSLYSCWIEVFWTLSVLFVCIYRLSAERVFFSL